MALIRGHSVLETTTHKQNLEIGFLICLVVAFIGFTGYYVVWPLIKPKPVPAQELPLSLQQAGNKTDAELQKLVANYGAEYDAAYQDVASSNAAQWDKVMLDKAYLVVLYADKIEAYDQVSTLLAKMQFAKANGLNLDDNSWGITGTKRDELKARADAFEKSTTLESGDE